MCGYGQSNGLESCPASWPGTAPRKNRAFSAPAALHAITPCQTPPHPPPPAARPVIAVQVVRACCAGSPLAWRSSSATVGGLAALAHPRRAHRPSPSSCRHPTSRAYRCTWGHRLQPDHHGQPDPLPPHGFGFNTVWCPAPTTPALPRRSWWKRQLQEQGISRHDMGPRHRSTQEFRVERSGMGNRSVWATITSQMRRMGDTWTGSREYFTMDDKLSKVVTDTFVKLYEQA